MKIGIPQALLYFWYGNLWERFWSDIGWEVETSPPTDHRILKSGVEAAIDELCLPVKVFLGHVRYLAPRVERIMIPHLIKVERDAYICPKFMGLPDLVRHALPNLKSQLEVIRVGPKDTDLASCLGKAALNFGAAKSVVNKARKELRQPLKSPGQQIAESFQAKNGETLGSKLTIGVLGHPYCIYDGCLNLNVLKRLSSLARFVTPEMLPDNFRGAGSGKLTKRLFWTMGKLQFDAVDWMLNQVKVDGFIQLVTFACGPEAIVGDLLERRIRDLKKPFLRLYFEEHSGEAGLITRLEAFIDLLRYRSRAC
jgi:predicted nucleotide-binding protein (sugar kinase/HSP70/actin superfamily)